VVVFMSLKKKTADRDIRISETGRIVGHDCEHKRMFITQVILSVMKLQQ